MLVMLPGIVTPTRLNAWFGIMVTLVPIVTLLNFEVSNAESSMLVTGKPLVMAGMVTSPPESVYPVMVIAPLLVVKLN